MSKITPGYCVESKLASCYYKTGTKSNYKMDLGTALSVAQTIFAALQCSELKKVCSKLGYKADLEKLQGTVETIKVVLLDADAKKEKLTHEAQLFIKKLKDAVYDADDLIDELATLARHKKLVKSNKLRLFSLFKEMRVAYNMSHGVRKLRGNLANIVDEHNKYGFSITPEPVQKRIEETCSYIYADDVIGRDDDVLKIRGMLLDSNVQNDVSFLTIAGMGGLGKTTLAQLVYNDEMVKDKFPLRLWACVSDQDLGHLDIGAVLRKVLASMSEKHDVSTLDGVQSKVRERLVKEKFLLVLDNVWTESRDEWLKLEGFFKGTAEGSWVLVTTRSTKTAEIVGKGLMHKLEGLSDENSWRLFERIAFQEVVKGADTANNLIEIGQKIVKKCANVPLAIRAVGSLLYGQDKTKWERVLDRGLANIRYEEKGIVSILKLSYDNLEPALKCCFSYCALFPKDVMIKKEMMVRLWIAQGYIVPLEKGQSIQDAAEEYYFVLLRRCFFQDVVKNYKGEITCKIHDLMHDIAVEVSGYEVVNSDTIDDLDKRVRHVSVTGHDSLKSSFKHTRIRTFLRVGMSWEGMDEFLVRKLLATCMRLRTLDLTRSKIKKLPDSIGKLLHLRYLDISGNDELKVIPKSITKLHNLIFLGIEHCDELTYLPLGMGKLTHLQTLERFMLGKANLNKTHFLDELENLQALVNLRGDIWIEIEIPLYATSVKKGNKGGAYLTGKQQLDFIGISIETAENCLRPDFEEMLLETLCPNSNLKGLALDGYNGIRMPSWGTGDKLCTFLPNLVRLGIFNCQKLQSLPWLAELRHLKYLILINLPNLEYIDDNSNPASGFGGFPFFSSLKELRLKDLPRLKRWWLGSPSSPCLSQLEKCKILYCSEMTSIPLCPSVKSLDISDNNRSLKLELKLIEDTCSSSSQHLELTTSNLRCVTLVPVECIQFATSMLIKDDEEMESLLEVRELFRNCFSSTLKVLTISNCRKLRSLCGVIEHLSELKSLSISFCPNLLTGKAEEDEEKDGIPWRHLGQTLHSLDLALDTMENLPEGMQYLTSLQTLALSGCQQLQSLPNWIPNLTSLEVLTISDCTKQLKGCYQDSHLIHHIPKVTLNCENSRPVKLWNSS